MDAAGTRTLHVEEGEQGRLGPFFAVLKDAVLHARVSDRRILDANPAFLTLFGYAREDLVGRPTEMLFADPADHVSTGERLRGIGAEGETLTFEHRARRKDGSTFLAEFTISTARDPADDGIKTFSIVRDLTAQRRQEARLHALLRAGDTLAGTASTREALDALLSLLVPAEARLVIVYLEREDGRLERAAIRHALQDDALDALWREYPDPPDLRGLPAGEVFATGRPVLTERVTDDLVRLAARDERHHQLLKRVGMKSSVLVPLSDRGRVVGALSLLRVEGEEPFQAADVPYFEEFGRKAGLTLENARLSDEQKAATARWKSLVEHAPDWIYMTDPEGRIQYINRGGRGGSPEQIVGTRAYDWFVPEDGERVKAAFDGVFATGRPATVTTTTTLEGSRRFELRLGPVLRDGAVQAITVTCIDVTQRLAAETALAEKEAHYRFLVDNGSDVVALSTPEGILRDLSPAITRVLGWTREDLVGRHFGDVVHPDDRERAIQVRRASVESNGEYALEVRGIHKDGAHVWLDVRGKVVTHAGSLHVLSTVRDVTQRKDAERALRESDARFRTLLAATTQMVWSTDAEGMILDLPEWRAYTGQGAEEVRGAGWLDAVHPDDRERLADAWEAAFAARGPYECEYRVRSRTGEYGHFLARAVPRFDDKGRLLEYIGTWNDVTEARRAVEQANALRLQLTQSEKLSALGSLVGGVAHEIRTPLTYLGTNLAILEINLERAYQELPPDKATPLKAKLDERLADARESIDRVTRIVEDLRKFTRLKSGHDRVEASLDALVHDAVELFRATHRGEIAVRDRLAPTAPIRADRVQIQQVVLNLMQNALDAKPSDDAIRIRTLDAPEGAILLVEDHGHGIPPDVQARMWEPFYTTKTEGSGLGLSIVKRILDQHDATVEVASVAGKGTTFRILFPRARKDASA